MFCCSGEETVATIAREETPPVGSDCHAEILSRLESTQGVQTEIPCNCWSQDYSFHEASTGGYRFVSRQWDE